MIVLPPGRRGGAGPGAGPLRHGERVSTDSKFASQADLEEKKVSFTQLSEHAWA